MSTQILPHDGVAVIDIDVKNLGAKSSAHEEPHAARCACVGRLVSVWRERRCMPCAFIVTMTASSVLCLLPAAMVVGFLDVETVTKLGRVVVFVAVYLGAWIVVSRVNRWLNAS